jgi:chromosome segregation ATPase
LQSLRQRPTPLRKCRVCLQQDPVTSVSDSDQYELQQLTDQLTEMDDQFDTIVMQLRNTTEAVSAREQRVASLSAKVEIRTAERITPRLQAFRDAADRLANARSQQGHRGLGAGGVGRAAGGLVRAGGCSSV